MNTHTYTHAYTYAHYITGLAHLHTECISHRDIKTKNILLKSDLQTACIADFDLAIKWQMETAADQEAQNQVSERKKEEKRGRRREGEGSREGRGRRREKGKEYVYA